MLGTPLIVALAAAGADGVRDLLRALNDEVRRNLRFWVPRIPAPSTRACFTLSKPRGERA